MQTNQKKKTKTYGLVGLGAPFRQGRSLWLPTLPYQRTNRYAVVSAMPVFVLLRLCIGYPNHYAVVGVMPTVVLLRSRISHTNRYAVDGVLSVFHLLHPRIGWSLAR